MKRILVAMVLLVGGASWAEVPDQFNVTNAGGVLRVVHTMRLTADRDTIIISVTVREDGGTETQPGMLAINCADRFISDAAPMAAAVQESKLPEGPEAYKLAIHKTGKPLRKGTAEDTAADVVCSRRSP